MKRIVVLALLLACRKAHDEPRQAPLQTAPPAPAAAPTAPAAPKTPATTTPAAAALQPIAGVMPVPGDFIIKDFTSTGGEKLPELRIHSMPLGPANRDASGRVSNAVLIIHGTTGSGQQ